MNRISVYLDEDEVTEQVSSLKKDYSEPYLPGAEDEGLGLEKATLKWNEVTEIPNKDQTATNDHPTSVTDETSTTVADSVSETSVLDTGDRSFELQDLSVVFPEGELTVVTGPTASGKTALLVS